MNPTAREMRTRFDKDVAWSAFAMLVPIAVGLAALPLIFSNVGQRAFTLFLLSYGAITFAPSFDLGIARTGQRRVAYAAACAPSALAALVSFSLRRAAIVSIAGAVLTMVGAAILFPHQGSALSRSGLVGVTGLGVALAIYSNCQRGVLEGLGAFSRSAINRAGVGVMLVGAPVAVSFFVRDATALSLAALLVRIPFVWEQQRAIQAALPTVADNEDQPGSLIQGFMRESGWFALLSALAVAMSGFDRYIVMGLGGLAGEPLAIFLATQDLALRAIAIPAALLPALAVRLAASNEDAVNRALSSRLFLVIVPGAVLASVCGAVLSGPLIQLLYPMLPVDQGAATLRVLFLGIAASAVAQFPMARLAAAGRARDAALMHLAQFALYLAVTPFVVQRFGAAGAAALWTGRIMLDAVCLIVWSGVAQGERAAMLKEGSALILGPVLIATIGLLA